MPLIISGANATISVTANQILTVIAHGGEYTFENPVGTRIVDSGSSNVFGPFAAAASVKLTSIQGDLYYEIAAAQVTASTTGATGPAGPAGATGATGPAGTFVVPTPRTSVASETIVLGDNNNIIRGNASTALAYTIPNDTTVAWPDQAVVSLYQMGSGIVSFAAGAGVTLRAPAGVAASVQYGVIAALRINANEWTLV